MDRLVRDVPMPSGSPSRVVETSLLPATALRRTGLRGPTNLPGPRHRRNHFLG
jgi:hypothetical protein